MNADTVGNENDKAGVEMKMETEIRVNSVESMIKKPVYNITAWRKRRYPGPKSVLQS